MAVSGLADNPIGEIFVAEFKKRMPGVEFSIKHVEHMGSTFVIPAAHPEVGDLKVMEADAELTLFLGQLTHWHCACYEIDQPVEIKRIETIVENAIDSIEALLSGETLIRVRYTDIGKIASAWMGSKDTIPATAKHRERDYLWSGPVARP